jgi:outer membrane lipoprotein-sorting protein
MTLLLALFLLQDPSDAGTFGKVDAALEKSTTIRLQFKSETHLKFQDHEERSILSGELSLQKGERMRMSFKRTRAGEEGPMVLILSDGKGIFDGRGSARCEAPKEFNRNFGFVALSRTGLSLALLAAAPRDGEIEPEEYDLRKRFGVSRPDSIRDDGKLKTFSYTLRFGEQESQVQLWVDPATSMPKKRTETRKVQNVVMTTVETYDSVVLNGDIPGDSFRLPAPK